MKLAKELFSQKKSVLVVKTICYILLVEVKTLDFFFETLPNSCLNTSLNRSDCGKSFGLIEVYIICLNRLYLSINFRDELLRFPSSIMVDP